MEQPQEGAAPQRAERDLSRVPPNLRAHCIEPGTTKNPGGISKETGEPGIRTAWKMRELLRGKLEADRERLDRILETRLKLCEASADIDPGVTLRAIDDLTEHLDGKLDKGVVNKGEPTVVVINGPRKVANVPPSP